PIHVAHAGEVIGDSSTPCLWPVLAIAKGTPRRVSLALRNQPGNLDAESLSACPPKQQVGPRSTAETPGKHQATHGVISASKGCGNQHVHQRSSARPLPHRQR